MRCGLAWTGSTSHDTTDAAASVAGASCAFGTFDTPSECSLAFGAGTQLQADVQQWLTAPAGNQGWLLDMPVGGSAEGFATCENANASIRARPTITCEPPAPAEGGDVPLPARTLGLPGLGCARLSRRHRNAWSERIIPAGLAEVTDVKSVSYPRPQTKRSLTTPITRRQPPAYVSRPVTFLEEPS